MNCRTFAAVALLLGACADPLEGSYLVELAPKGEVSCALATAHEETWVITAEDEGYRLRAPAFELESEDGVEWYGTRTDEREFAKHWEWTAELTAQGGGTLQGVLEQKSYWSSGKTYCDATYSVAAKAALDD